jgi:Fur family ferric uptake transcriptional regulator
MTGEREVRMRQTKQRTAISAVVEELANFHSAQDIHAELARRGSKVGLSTVYRALSSMAADGDVDTLLRDDGETLYRQCEVAAHHHHLVCRVCGATVEVDGPTVEAWTRKIAAQNDFDEVSHTLEIFGRCSRCRTS